MKPVLFFLFAVLFFSLGAVATVRAVQDALADQIRGPFGMQGGLGLSFLFLGWKSFQKARTRPLPKRAAP